MWKLDRLLTCKSVDQAQQEKDPASLKKHDCLIPLLALFSSGLPFYSWPFLAFFCQYCLAIFEPVFPEEWIFCTSFRTLFFSVAKEYFCSAYYTEGTKLCLVTEQRGYLQHLGYTTFFSINQLATFFFGQHFQHSHKKS